MQCVLLLALIVGVLSGQEITIVSPGFTVITGRTVPLYVLNVEDSTLPQLTVTVTPDTQVSLWKYKDWSDKPLLAFAAEKPGKYTITIALNAWRQDLTNAIVSFKASNPDPQLLQELDTVVAKLADKYPIRFGSCTIEVAADPFIPPEPDPKPSPTTGKKRITILLERAETTPELGRLIATVRLQTGSTYQYLQQKGHLFQVLDDDHSSVSEIASKVSQRPALVIQDLQSGVINYSGDVPLSTSALLEVLKQYGG